VVWIFCEHGARLHQISSGLVQRIWCIAKHGSLRGQLSSETSFIALTTIAAMEVAKRLTFDPTDTLTSGLQDPSQQRYHTADMAALQDLQQ
jgi:hypothetical protein